MKRDFLFIVFIAALCGASLDIVLNAELPKHPLNLLSIAMRGASFGILFGNRQQIQRVFWQHSRAHSSVGRAADS